MHGRSIHSGQGFRSVLMKPLLEDPRGIPGIRFRSVEPFWHYQAIALGAGATIECHRFRSLAVSHAEPSVR